MEIVAEIDGVRNDKSEFYSTIRLGSGSGLVFNSLKWNPYQKTSRVLQWKTDKAVDVAEVQQRHKESLEQKKDKKKKDFMPLKKKDEDGTTDGKKLGMIEEEQQQHQQQHQDSSLKAPDSPGTRPRVDSFWMEEEIRRHNAECPDEQRKELMSMMKDRNKSGDQHAWWPYHTFATQDFQKMVTTNGQHAQLLNDWMRDGTEVLKHYKPKPQAAPTLKKTSSMLKTPSTTTATAAAAANKTQWDSVNTPVNKH